MRELEDEVLRIMQLVEIGELKRLTNNNSHVTFRYRKGDTLTCCRNALKRLQAMYNHVREELRKAREEVKKAREEAIHAREEAAKAREEAELARAMSRRMAQMLSESKGETDVKVLAHRFRESHSCA